MTADLIALAREAGVAGRTWDLWTASDVVQDALIEAVTDLDTDALEAAFLEGRRQHRIANGWRTVWTTAPADYDWFGTETIVECGEWHGKKLRSVLIDPDQYQGQTDRYFSGMHPSLDEDPRVAEERAKVRAAQDKVEREVREATRQAGLTWLTTATEDELEDFDGFEARGLRYQDIRVEKARRSAAVTESARLSELARCEALVPRGATLIDDGSPAERGVYGYIPGRPTHVWYNVFVQRAYPDDAEHNYVHGEGLDHVGSLAYVADWIVSGRLRVATAADNVPPRAVVQRVGHDRFKDIRHVEVEGRHVWVFDKLWRNERLVLDERGHIVRAKKIVEAALAQVRP